VILAAIFGLLASLSLVLLLWQWWAGWRFPLHQRLTAHAFLPAVTLLKPLKGCDRDTEDCLRSWFAQEYTGRVQILFGVASADDPVCDIVRKLQEEFPSADSQLIVCAPLRGANAKVSKLMELERLASHELFIISDADVGVPSDLVTDLIERMRSNTQVGLVHCFYGLAKPETLAMRWEAIAINADFWSQVLQSQTLKPIDFALGAVMATGRKQLREIGGFAALADCLADDYQLGHRLVQRGYHVTLSNVAVDCSSAPMGWRGVWKHQLRWARTIRVCQPVPYFFSILSNATFWPLVWFVAHPAALALSFAVACWLTRIVAALELQTRLTRRRDHFAYWWLVPIKDLLQCVIWLLAFAGNRIEWRGEQMRLRRDGTLMKTEGPAVRSSSS